jgi:riboflavin kinase/FMN adenylyltransferase
MDFDAEIYGQELAIELLHRLRGEMKFESAEDLIEAMHGDIRDTRDWFRAHPGLNA